MFYRQIIFLPTPDRIDDAMLLLLLLSPKATAGEREREQRGRKIPSCISASPIHSLTHETTLIFGVAFYHRQDPPCVSSRDAYSFSSRLSHGSIVVSPPSLFSMLFLTNAACLSECYTRAHSYFYCFPVRRPVRWGRRNTSFNPCFSHSVGGSRREKIQGELQRIRSLPQREEGARKSAFLDVEIGEGIMPMWKERE